jgi:hypothetical protein
VLLLQDRTPLARESPTALRFAALSTEPSKSKLQKECCTIVVDADAR